MKNLFILMLSVMMASVAVAQLPTATMTGDQTIQSGQVATLSVSFTNGPVDFVYTDGLSYYTVYGVETSPLLLNVAPVETTTYSPCSVSNRYGSGTVSGSATVTVNSGGGGGIVVPILSFNPPDVCQGSDAIILQNYFTANPGGGTVSFEGVGIVDGIFYAGSLSPGMYSIIAYYSYAGQVYTCHATMYVYSKPVVKLILPAQVLQNSKPLPLTGGYPVGGFYFGDGVENGYLHPSRLSLGQHTIYYSYANEHGCQDVAQATINVVALGHGLDEQENGGLIYPNPVSDVLYLTSPHQVEVYDIRGQILKSSINEVTIIPFGDLPDGMYIIRLASGGIITTIRKIVKQ